MRGLSGFIASLFFVLKREDQERCEAIRPAAREFESSAEVFCNRANNSQSETKPFNLA